LSAEALAKEDPRRGRTWLIPFRRRYADLTDAAVLQEKRRLKEPASRERESATRTLLFLFAGFDSLFLGRSFFGHVSLSSRSGALARKIFRCDAISISPPKRKIFRAGDQRPHNCASSRR
jgi:hypothetical protein